MFGTCSVLVRCIFTKIIIYSFTIPPILFFYSMRSKDNPHVRTVEGRAGEWCFEESGVGETNERNLAAPLLIFFEMGLIV